MSGVRERLILPPGATGPVALVRRAPPGDTPGGFQLGTAVLTPFVPLFIQIVGVGAAAKLIADNFLFAQDRERTTKKLRCAPVCMMPLLPGRQHPPALLPQQQQPCQAAAAPQTTLKARLSSGYSRASVELLLVLETCAQ